MKNTILAIIGIFALSACGDFESGGTNSISSFGIVPSEARIAPSQAVVSTVSQNQVFPNYLTCTGLSENDLPNNLRIPASGNTNRRTQLLNAMSAEGVASDMSSGQAKALLDLTAEICAALISKETNGNRKYFSGFNLNGNNDGGNLSVSNTAQALASSCWGRAAKPEELSLIDRNVASTNRVSDNQGFDKALYVCTAVLASSEAIKF